MEALLRQVNAPASRVKPNESSDGGLGAWLNSSSKSDTNTKRALPRLEEATKRSAEAAENEDREGALKRQKKVGTGLEAVLDKARGIDNTPNTLERTKDKWREFKKNDGEVAEELEAYKKDKNRYTERMSFLERSSHREWEVEQAGKKSRN